MGAGGGKQKTKPNQENLKPENNRVRGNRKALSIRGLIINSLYFPIKNQNWLPEKKYRGDNCLLSLRNRSHWQRHTRLRVNASESTYQVRGSLKNSTGVRFLISDEVHFIPDSIRKNKAGCCLLIKQG